MTALSDPERALILRHLSALAQHGMPLGKAIPLLASKVPGVAARRFLESAAAAMARGEPLPDDEPMLTLLVRAETAGGGALEEASRGLELLEQGRRMTRAGWIQGVAVASVIWLIAAGTVFGVLPPLGVEKSWPQVLVWAMAAVLVAAMVLRRRLLRWMPGSRRYERAGRLHLRAAGLTEGLSPQLISSWLDQTERGVLDGRRGGTSLDDLAFAAAIRSPLETEALQVLAAEDEAEARVSFERFIRLAKPAAYAMLVGFVGVVVVTVFIAVLRRIGELS